MSAQTSAAGPESAAPKAEIPARAISEEARPRLNTSPFQGEEFARVRKFMSAVAGTLSQPLKAPAGRLKVGLDLGTAYIVLVVLDQNNRPLGTAMEFARVVRDGLLVDFSGARAIVARLKEKLEAAIGAELTETALAMPPGTGANANSHRYVAEGVGLEVTNILDEPVAANLVLKIQNGAIVDIGGGTTGVALIENGRVTDTFDEPTGGTHLTLVIQGNRGLTFEEAEALKTNPARHREILPLVAPVIQKMGRIVSDGLKGRRVETLYLVGGAPSLAGFAEVMAKETGLPTFVAPEPLLVTPAGIALAC